jgi:hypothetical protein
MDCPNDVIKKIKRMEQMRRSPNLENQNPAVKLVALVAP